MKNVILFFGIIIAVALAACDGEGKFSVSGEVEGAGDSTVLVLEYTTNGMWVTVDSVTTDGKGHFKFSEPAPEYPNIFRIRRGDDAIYFPIDSLDHLTLKTTANAFATDYTLAGSDHAVQVMNIDKKALEFARAAAIDTTAFNNWKHDLAVELLKDPSGIVAYYIINKNIGDNPIFDPLNNKDLKVIGAVANAFHSYKPNDPRTQYLVNVLLDGQRRRRDETNRHDTIHATQAALINISLQDVHGKVQDLEKVASRGSVVILNFTIMDAQFSPALNKVLNDIYTAHHAQGLEVYQISLDPNEADWLTQARRLPWICVRDPHGEYSKNVSSYNVLGVPTSFIIGRNGEIVERIEDPQQLEAAVKRHL